MTRQSWLDLAQKMDVNGNDQISYSEFLVAAADKRELLSQENVDTVFRTFDIDGSGSISLEDLQQVFNASRIGK